MPFENGPRHIIRLESVAFEKLVEPVFRSLLAAFDAVDSSPSMAQVS